MCWSARVSDNVTISAIGENARLKIKYKMAIKSKLVHPQISFTHQNNRQTIVNIFFRTIVKCKTNILFL